MPRHATAFSALANMINTLVGSGLLAMPLAFKSDGVGVGLAILLIAALTCGFGFYLQLRVACYVPKGKANFFVLCELTYPLLAVVFDAIIAFNCFGGCLSFWVLIGDLMPQVAGAGLRQLWIALLLVVIVPLCCLRRLDGLRLSSVLAVGAISYIVVLVVGNYALEVVAPVSPPRFDRGGVYWGPVDVHEVFRTFSILLFAFCGHHNMFTLINELGDRLQTNVNRVIYASIGVSLAMYTVVGLSGYLTFGSNVSGNIMLMYGKSTATTVGQAALLFLCLLTVPLMFHPCRLLVYNVYLWCLSRWGVSGPAAAALPTDTTPLLDEELAIPGEVEEFLEEVRQSLTHEQVVEQVILPIGTGVYVTITTVLLAVGYLLSLCITSFALVLEIVGATGCTCIALILPGLFGHLLIGTNKVHHLHAPPSVVDPVPWVGDAALRRWSLALACWGAATMAACLYALVARSEYVDRV